MLPAIGQGSLFHYASFLLARQFSKATSAVTFRVPPVVPGKEVHSGHCLQNNKLQNNKLAPSPDLRQTVSSGILHPAWESRPSCVELPA